MNHKEVVKRTADYVRDEMLGEGSGHDWWHVYRVWKLARHIAELEAGADIFVVDMTSLLHDLGDPKLHGGDTTIAPKMVGEWLGKMDVGDTYTKHIMHIIANMSFSKSFDGKEVEKSLEFLIVQDADRLDGIGAMGIARTFAYGGHKNREMYNPDRKPQEHLSAAEYHASDGTTVNHFYEKLLLLKDKMNTDTAREIAQARHEFMEQFLDRFYKEWDGNA